MYCIIRSLMCNLCPSLIGANPMRSLIALLFGLALCTHAWGGGQAETLRFCLTWSIDIDASGKVSNQTYVQGSQTMPKSLIEALEQKIKTWEFEPGAINGKPAATSTALLVVTHATLDQKNDTFQFRIADVSTGPRLDYRSNMQPAFPEAVSKRMRDQREKTKLVLLRIHFSPEGKALSVDIDDQSPTQSGRLTLEAIKAAKTWTFVPEVVGGTPREGIALVPVCFQIGDNDHCKQITTKSGATLEAGQSLALDSQVKLRTDVLGGSL